MSQGVVPPGPVATLKCSVCTVYGTSAWAPPVKPTVERPAAPRARTGRMDSRRRRGERRMPDQRRRCDPGYVSRCADGAGMAAGGMVLNVQLINRRGSTMEYGI